jgi:immune inhibitor A
MRRIALLIALAALLAGVAAEPARASSGQALMPANELLIGRALKQRGVIPKGASRAQVRRAVRAYLRAKLGRKPEDRPVVAAAGSSAAGLAATAGSGAFSPAGPLLSGTEYPGFGGSPHGSWNVGPDGVATDKVLVILVDFGGPWSGKTGPLHGAIPAPGDSSTFWPGDFSTQHYRDMLFGDSFPIYDAAHVLRGTSTDTMKRYYLEQSHRAYTVGGDVAGWVTLPYPEAYYGQDSDANHVDDKNGPAWRVVRDAAAAFAAANPSFPWAAYDHENPHGIVTGGFDQPDGYIDHLVIVHAGVDQSAGGGAQGDDAIWAHSWWVDSTNGLGPGNLGGYQIPGTSEWIGPYTINPEDGGIGVFCHEFGHDLGLPDEYDTSYAGESPSSFWTLMASGSWLGKQWGAGTKPSPMNAWDKYYLGWIDPITVARGTTATVDLSPAQSGDTGDVAVKVELPAVTHSTTVSGPDGNPEWCSRSGNNLDDTLTTVGKVSVPPSAPTLSFKTWYDIEQGWDFGYVEVSTDGTSWSLLASITGVNKTWTTKTYSLAGYAGQQVYLRFRYHTDQSVSQLGWELDDITVSGGAFFDGAASTAQLAADPAASWSIVDGQRTTTTDRYYIGECRTRKGFDAALGDCYTQYGDWFPLNTGLLLIYRDTQWSDNDVGMHPGEGGWLPVDAHPTVDGSWATRIQVRDAAFGRTYTGDRRLYNPSTGTYQTLLGHDGEPTFDDTRTYWYASKPDAGVKVPTLGVSLQVLRTGKGGLVVGIDDVP